MRLRHFFFARLFRIGGALAVLALIAGFSAACQAEMTLTAAGIAEGFTLTTFATNFPNANGAGPLGIEFPGTGVMVSDLLGNVRVFPSDTDGQDAGAVPAAANYGARNAAGIAQVGDRFYMAQQGLQRVVQINPDGTFTQAIAAAACATGAAADPFTGHLFVSADGCGGIFDVDPIAKTATLFNNAVADGLSLSSDGLTLYGAILGHILGFNTITKAQVFDSGIINGVDGTAIGAGQLAGKIFGNTNFGELWEVDLVTTNKTLIASGGSRGDFVTVDPSNGTLLLTQTDRILRVGPEGRFGSFTFKLSPAVATNTVGQTHTVTVAVTTNSTPAADISVTIEVTGANTATGTCLTDANGTCAFSYTGTNAGDDVITARADIAGAERTATASKTWLAVAQPVITCEVQFFTADGQPITSDPCGSAGAGVPVGTAVQVKVQVCADAANSAPVSRFNYFLTMDGVFLVSCATTVPLDPDECVTSCNFTFQCDTPGVHTFAATVTGSDGASTTCSATLECCGAPPQHGHGHDQQHNNGGHRHGSRH
jgi:hypothetical protein